VLVFLLAWFGRAQWYDVCGPWVGAGSAGRMADVILDAWDQVGDPGAVRVQCVCSASAAVQCDCSSAVQCRFSVIGGRCSAVQCSAL
jgi:hypothetical protein